MRVCVFCGSTPPADLRLMTVAERLGRVLVDRGTELVYGGGKLGLMGAVAEGALAAGGSVIGVMPAHLIEKEIAHPALTDFVVVETMHERKAQMAELSDAFVTLPGGLGTLEELFEIWTWAQLGLHHKPVGLLDVDGFYRPLLRMIDTVVDAGFLRPVGRDSLLVDEDPARLLDRFATYVPPPDRWADATPDRA